MVQGTVPLLHSLRFRLIASVVAIEVIMLSVLVWNNISIIQTTHTNRLRDTAVSMIQQIASTSGSYMVAVDYATLKDYLSNILNYRELSYIVITDRDQNEVIRLGEITPDYRNNMDIHPANVDDGVFDIAENIQVGDLPMGRLFAGFSLSLMDDAIRKSRNRGITIALIEIILTIGVTVLIGLGLTRRLGQLSNAAANVEAGNYSVSVPTEVDDEVGKTAAAFNRMVTEVSNRNEQLELEQSKTQKLLNENRQLIHSSLEVQEEERKHLARELHDELGQCLTAIQADAELIKDISQQCDERVGTSATEIMNVSSHVYDVVHSIMQRLRPSTLDYLGLVEALKDEIDVWNARHPEILCVFTATGNMSDLGERTNISLYRIVQECLTNVSKHASADHLDINLSNDGTRLSLTFSDNGTGIDEHAQEKTSGLGLIGMRERVDALGGNFRIHSAAGSGTTIILTIPMNRPG